ncbi:hypothetical protein ABGB16_27105 [Micromonospora sp. B11E3]|uniref:hypothetical protein n=1 Tax=Micromonospora sp. B11E3 TaxID=3153562 RepID=UPI00325D2D26
MEIYTQVSSKAARQALKRLGTSSTRDAATGRRLHQAVGEFGQKRRVGGREEPHQSDRHRSVEKPIGVATPLAYRIHGGAVGGLAGESDRDAHLRGHGGVRLH